MNTPLVSVLITAYNRERYLGCAIESVLAQTFRDYELIVVDDCSHDETVKVARRYAKDSKVRLVVNKKNLGQFQNRNFAASLAIGKYIKYVDSDDVIYPHCLEVMVSSMEHFPDAGFGLAKDYRPDVIYPVQLDPVRSYREELMGKGLFGNAPSSTIYRRAAFEECKGFLGAELFTGDTYLLFALGARYPVVLFPTGLNWYRIHCQQALPIGELDIKLAERIRYVSEFLQSTECPLPQDELPICKSNSVGAFARYCLRLAIRGKITRAVRLWKASCRPLSDLRYACKRPVRKYSYGTAFSQSQRNGCTYPP